MLIKVHNLDEDRNISRRRYCFSVQLCNCKFLLDEGKCAHLVSCFCLTLIHTLISCQSSNWECLLPFVVVFHLLKAFVFAGVVLNFTHK